MTSPRRAVLLWPLLAACCWRGHAAQLPTPAPRTSAQVGAEAPGPALRLALDFIGAQGITLRVSLPGADEQAELARLAREQRLGLEDKLVQRLLGAQLRGGLAEPLRLSAEEAERHGFSDGRRLSAAAAARAFRSLWLSKIEENLHSLFGPDRIDWDNPESPSPDGAAEGADATSAFSLDKAILAVGNERGEVTVWNLAEGRRRPAARMSLPAAVARLTFSSDGRRLAASSRSGDLALLDWPSRSVLRLKFGDHDKELAQRLNGDGELVVDVKRDRHYARLRIPDFDDASKFQRSVESLDAAAEAAAAWIFKADNRQLHALAGMIDFRQDKQLLVHAIWKHLARAILSGYGAPRLKPADGARWGKQARRMLRREFPTLRRILADPLKTERLLAALGFLRLVHASYKYCHVTGLPMGVWGREHRVEFPLNELLFRPVSGSFRRHLLASERSPRQLQLKIPGEDKNRDWISPAHFEAAAELMAAYPDLELAPEPIHLGQWTGRARLYGKDLRFDENNPLGVMIFDYKDGQRLKYAAWLADAIDPSRRMELLLKAMADAAAGSIVAHRLGWQGNGEAGADMHTENASVFVDGAELRGMLSGDFGAWWKNSGLTMRQRSKETLNLIGWPDEWRLEVIAAQVLDILGRGRGAAQRQQLQREIRLELGMDE